MNKNLILNPEDFSLNLARLNKYRGPILEISYNNGDGYKGQVKKGRKHGEGEFKLGTGEMYQGLFKHDLFHGEGKLSHKG